MDTKPETESTTKAATKVDNPATEAPKQATTNKPEATKAATKAPEPATTNIPEATKAETKAAEPATTNKPEATKAQTKAPTMPPEVASTAAVTEGPTEAPTTVNPCDPNPCKNGGNCTGNGFCQCPELFAGKKCDLGEKYVKCRHSGTNYLRIITNAKAA